jgi:two-component system chemotaxis response regulator CheY
MRHVLVVEDDPTTRLVLADALGTAGWTVIEAQDGGEALEAAERFPLDVIVLDLAMPEVDGWTVLARRRESPHLSRIPVVVLSAVRDARQDAEHLGAEGWVPKPFDLNALVRLVQQIPYPRDTHGRIMQCAWCGCVQDQDGVYGIQPGIMLHSESHGVCPTCLRDLEAEARKARRARPPLRS